MKISGTINAAAGVTLTGDEALDAYLESLPTRVAKSGMRTATRKVAKYVLQLAAGLAPEDTGALIASLKVRAAKRRKYAPWLISTSVRTGENLFKGDQYYGGFLEFGTVDRKHKSGKSVGRIDRSRWAFLVPALFAYLDTKRLMFSEELAAWVRSQKGAAKR